MNTVEQIKLNRQGLHIDSDPTDPNIAVLYLNDVPISRMVNVNALNDLARKIGEGLENAFLPPIKNTAWREQLDGRQLKEIEFSRLYANEFGHGTDGHNRLLLIAKLVELLDSK